MNPILFDDVPAAASWGLGRLAETKSAKVTETLNGDFTAVLEVPASSETAKELSPDKIIALDLPRRNGLTYRAEGGRQYFQIQKVSKPTNGILTVDADHVSHRLKRYLMTRHVDSSAWTAFTDYPHVGDIDDFDFDLSHICTWLDDVMPPVKTPMTCRDYLSGAEGSITDHQHCDWIFNNFKVTAVPRRGQDTGYILRRGTGLKDAKIDESIANVYTAVFPFWMKEENGVVDYIELPDAVDCQYAGSYAQRRIEAVDVSMEFQTKPTEAQLRTWAASYMQRKRYGTPSVSIKVNMNSAAGSTSGDPEFYDSDGNPMSHDLYLGDSVIFMAQVGDIDIETTPRIVKYEYDVLSERYVSLELGTITPTLSKTLFAVLRKTGVKAI